LAALIGVVIYNYLKVKDVRTSQLSTQDGSAKVSLLSNLSLFCGLINIHALFIVGIFSLVRIVEW